jgi:nuclear GTP-binding protein
MPKSFRAGKLNGARRAGNASTNPERVPTAKAKAGAPSVRSKATINRLNLYRSRVKRDKSGAIIKGGLPVGKQVQEMQAARVQPDRRWFGNTRVVGQQELQDFREQVAQTAADPYAVLLRRHKLPMGLLKDGNIKKGRVDLLRAQSYAEAFGRRERGDGDEENLREEFADVLAWLTTLANICDVDLETAIREKYLTDGGPKGVK